MCTMGVNCRLKDCDVTWLYGPLQSQTNSLAPEKASPVRGIPRSSSFSDAKKPILKKRSQSEVILTSLATKPQGILRAAEHVLRDTARREQELAALREQNPLTPTHVLVNQVRMRSASLSPICATALSTQTDYFSLTTSSTGEISTPSGTRHIHFNDRVEQCIAVDAKEEEEDEDEYSEDLSSVMEEEDDSDSDELFMMRPRSSTSATVTRKGEHHTIAKLPATTLRPGDYPAIESVRTRFGMNILGGRRMLGTRTPSVVEDDFGLPEGPGFYYEEGGGFSSSTSPPDFPRLYGKPHVYLPETAVDDLEGEDNVFTFESLVTDPATSESRSDPSSMSSSRRSSSIDLEAEFQRRASVAAIPIPVSVSASRRLRDGGLMGEEEDEEGAGIVGLAADALSTAKGLVGVLWNAGWGIRRR
jgi:hypothetical protein